MSYKKLGYLDKAVNYLQQEIELNPLISLPYTNLADIYVKKYDFKMALSIYEKLIASDYQKPESYYLRALFYKNVTQNYNLSHGDLSKALELSKVENSNSKAKYLYIRAIVNTKLEKFNNAIEDFSKALEINSKIEFWKDDYIYSQIGNCYASLGNIEKALINHNKEISFNESASAYAGRAIFYNLFLNDYVNAKMDFQKALSIDSKSDNINILYLKFLYDNKEFDEALEYIKTASKLDTNEPQYDYISALIYSKINKPFKYLIFLNSCIEKLSDYSNIGYFISPINDLRIDLSELLIMRSNFYKDRDKELMCKDLNYATNFIFNASQKVKIESMLATSCE